MKPVGNWIAKDKICKFRSIRTDYLTYAFLACLFYDSWFIHPNQIYARASPSLHMFLSLYSLPFKGVVYTADAY